MSFGSYQDDLLAAMQLFAKQYPSSNVEQDFLGEAYRVLDVRLDHSLEANADYLFKSPMVQRCLGTQLALSDSSEQKPRLMPAKIAQAFLNIRSITLSMGYTLKSVSAAINPDNDARKQQESDARKTGMLRAHSFGLLLLISVALFRRASICNGAHFLVFLPHGLHRRRALPTQ